MPDKNFEQQAHDMADGFGMAPTPEVWQNVRNAIQQPQRKRRFVLWWWLLPLGLLGGSAAVYMLKPKNKQAPVTNVATQQPDNKNGRLPKQSNGQPFNDSDVTKKEDQKDMLIRQKTTNKNQQSSATSRSGAHVVYNESNSHKLAASNVLVVSKTVKPLSITSNNKSQPAANDSFAMSYSPPAAATNDSIVENHAAIPPADTLNVALSHQDSSLTKAPLVDSTAKIIIVKQKKKTALHLGIVAEGGTATRKSNGLFIGGLDKSLADDFTFPNSNSSGSNITGLTGRGVYFSNTIKKGAAFEMGIALQKPLNRSVDVSAALAYHYQSFGVTSVAYKDSLLLNNSFSSFVGSYGAKQSFQFASVLATLNWHFINTKKLQFGISAGADNLLLLTAKQKLNGVTSTSFSLQDAQQISDSTFSINNFYRYQPGLFAGILINIKTGNRQLQVIPFTLSSFRLFDKNVTGNNNHLFSAGLSAQYFFK